MAKRKRGGRKGFKLNLDKDYRSERYTMHLMNAEIGILQASLVEPELTDGEVKQALTDLIARLAEPGGGEALLAEQTTPEEPETTSDDEEQLGLVPHFILMNLRSAFAQYGPLAAEDVIGILEVIKTSLKRWGHGDHRQGYLTYIKDFLGQAGVETQLLTEEEVENLEFYQAEAEPPPKRLQQGDNDA